jgi:hypothetical protein
VKRDKRTISGGSGEILADPGKRTNSPISSVDQTTPLRRDRHGGREKTASGVGCVTVQEHKRISNHLKIAALSLETFEQITGFSGSGELSVAADNIEKAQDLIDYVMIKNSENN